MAFGGIKRSPAGYFILCAALLAASLVYFFVPLFSIIAGPVIPVPLALVVRRFGLKEGVLSLLLVVVIMSMITGPGAAIVITQAGLPGLLLGLIFKNHMPSGQAIAATVLFAAAITAGALVAGYFAGNSPFTMHESYKYIFEQERQFINELGARGGDQNQAAAEELERVLDRLEAQWPVFYISLSFIWFMVSAYLSYILSRAAIIRSGFNVPAAALFYRWRLPWYAIWGFIAGLILMLAGDRLWFGNTVMTGKAIIVVMAFVFAVLGVSTALYYFRRWKAGGLIKFLTVLLLCLYIPVTAAALVVLGVIDTLADIRRLTPDSRVTKEDEKK